MIFRDVIEIKTETNKFYDITKEIKSIVEKQQIGDGICNLFLQATTAGFMVNENDRMLYEDMRNFFKNVAPENKFYTHPENAFSHIRASMLNQSLSIPVASGELVLGAWQRILLWEFDVKPRERKIVVTISD